LSIDELQASNLVITAFNGGITIQSNTGFEKGTVFALYNLSGQLVGSTELSTSKQHYVQMATQALCPGIYIISLQSPLRKLTRKWLKTFDF
jgi:hypothetical protein